MIIIKTRPTSPKEEKIQAKQIDVPGSFLFIAEPG
jgi:hypothetical protein